jgi:hypothetical protein
MPPSHCLGPLSMLHHCEACNWRTIELCCQNFIRTHGSSQIDGLSAYLGWVYDLSFPIEIYRVVLSRNVWYS